MPSAKVIRERRLKQKQQQQQVESATPPPLLSENKTADFGPKISAQEKAVELTRRDEVISQEIKDRVEYAANARPQAGAAASAPVIAEDKYKFDSFDDPNQRYVVVNFAHRDQRPKKDRPALRLLGAFATTAEADAYIREAAPLLHGCNLWRLETQKWMLVCRSMQRQQDAAYTAEKVEALKKIYGEDKSRRDADFRKNRENKELGQTELSLEKQKIAAAKKRNAKVSSRLKALRKRGGKVGGGTEEERIKSDALLNEQATAGTNDVPSQLLRRKQDYVVASFMKDVTKSTLSGADDPEPACIIWRFFATDDMAKAWMKGIGSKYIRDYDTEIVDNYEWLFPEDVDREKIEETWRHPEQNKIMLQSKAEPGRVAEFQQWCKANNMEMPVTEVVADDLPVAHAQSLTFQPKDLEAEVPRNEIKLPAPTFSVACVETKKSEEEPVRIVQGLDSDYDYLRRPLLSVNSVKEAHDPNQGGKINYNAVLQAPREEPSDEIHAPEDD